MDTVFRNNFTNNERRMKKKSIKQKTTTVNNLNNNVVFIDFKTGTRFANYESWLAWVQLGKVG